MAESTFSTVSTLRNSDITKKASAELVSVTNQVDSGTLKDNGDLFKPLDPFFLTNSLSTGISVNIDSVDIDDITHRLKAPKGPDIPVRSFSSFGACVFPANPSTLTAVATRASELDLMHPAIVLNARRLRLYIRFAVDREDTKTKTPLIRCEEDVNKSVLHGSLFGIMRSVSH